MSTRSSPSVVSDLSSRGAWAARGVAWLWTTGVAAAFLWNKGPDFHTLSIEAEQWPFLVLLVLAGVGLPAGLALHGRLARGTRPGAVLLAGWGLLGLLALCGVSADRLASRLAAGSLAVLVLAAAALLGGAVLDHLQPNRLRPAERLALGLGLGLGLLSLAVMILGTLVGLSAVVGTAILLVAVLAGARGARKRAANLGATFRGIARTRSPGELLLLGAVLLGLWLPLAANFLPPVDYDVTSYHAQLPRQYVAERRVSFDPHNAWSGMPQNMEMLTTLAFALRGPRAGWPAAKLVHWAFLGLTVAAVMLCARRLAGRGGALVAGALLLGVPRTVSLGSLLYVELGLAAYGLFGLLALLIWRDSRASGVASDRFALAVAGAFAGLSAGTKYPGLLFFAAPLAACAVVLAAAKPDARRAHRALCAGGWVCAGLLVTLGPWVVRNAAQAGNPVYPLWNQTLGVDHWTPTLEARFHHAHRADDYSAAALGRHLADLFAGGKELYPVPLLFLGGLLLVGRRPGREQARPAVPASPSQDKGKDAYDGGAFLVAALLVWWVYVVAAWFLFTHRLERFLFPAMALAAVLSGIGWARLGRYARGAGLALVIAFLPLALHVSAWGMFFDRNPHGLSVAWGRAGPQARLVQVPSWRAGQVLEAEAPQGRILAVGEAAGFWLPPNAHTAVVFGPHPLLQAVEHARDADDLAAALARQGYTHLYIDWMEAARLRATYYQAYALDRDEQARLRAFLTRYADPPACADFVPTEQGRMPRTWPPLTAPRVRFADVVQEDRTAYGERFGQDLGPGSLRRAHLSARPWLGRLATEPGTSLDPAGQRLAALWRDWDVLLAPGPTGGAPPVAHYPRELIRLRLATRQ